MPRPLKHSNADNPRGIFRGSGNRTQASWYDSAMQPAASKSVATTRKKTKKHIAPPASLEEISKGLGVTREDKAIVRKVLTELGYIGKKSANARNASRLATKSRKG